MAYADLTCPRRPSRAARGAPQNAEFLPALDNISRQWCNYTDGISASSPGHPPARLIVRLPRRIGALLLWRDAHGHGEFWPGGLFMRIALTNSEDTSWQDLANCLGVDPDLFFPERGASTREAKEVCRGCVVREDCLEYALRNGEKFGIWGGMSERERRRIRRQRAVARAAGLLEQPSASA